MSDFYEPTLLFRQNAIKRNGTSSDDSSMESLNTYTNRSSDSSNTSKISPWLYKTDNTDTEITNKVCSLNRMNIRSNYWRIPDNDMHLTSIATQLDKGYEGDNTTLAVSSGGNQSNLFIYDLGFNDNYLTHHNTITLPNINSLRWVPHSSRLLTTGNNKGYAHLISVPHFDENGESAEIIKRFNHRKHLKSIGKDASVLNQNTSNISKMNFINDDNLLTIYDDNLFNWDLNDNCSSLKPSPLSIHSIGGLENFDNYKFHNDLVGICGKFGVSIFDLREPTFSVPQSLTKQANKKKLAANVIKWSNTNSNIFAASHLDGVIRLWDIRKQDNFGNLDGHNHKLVNDLEWVDNDLFSGGKDGNIVHWDLTTGRNESLMDCTLKEGLSSVKFDKAQNSLAPSINQRQCGTILPASNSNIVSLESIRAMDGDLKLLSIDGSSFFGLHSRIYDAVNTENAGQSKLYYTNDDIRMMNNSSNSNNTLVNNDDDDNDTQSVTSFDFTKPLNLPPREIEVKTPSVPIRTPKVETTPTIKRTPTHKSDKSIEIISEHLVNNNSSNDTLLNSPTQPQSSPIFSTNVNNLSDSTLDSHNNISPISYDSNTSCDSLSTDATSLESPNPNHHAYDKLPDLNFGKDFVFDNSIYTPITSM